MIKTHLAWHYKVLTDATTSICILQYLNNEKAIDVDKFYIQHVSCDDYAKQKVHMYYIPIDDYKTYTSHIILHEFE